ncbi:MAG: hypothetical protein JXQ90_06675 [Cyclobacteriaceae bacterium]
MDKPRELYHEEVSNLQMFRDKLDAHAIYKEDLDHFSDNYEELVAQAKVITRVSDRLQKKLDKANVQIREQNDEIKEKNTELATTVEQLAKARVGRRAATFMLVIALGLFMMEQIWLQPKIDKFVSETFSDQYVGYGSLVILLILFFVVKFFEGALESYFMNKEKKKIIEKDSSGELSPSIAN